jgi:phosphonatase-like hydrolase
MQIELVVFDMAGTTVSEGGAVYQALRDTLAANGLHVTDEAIHQVKGTDKREALRVLIEQSALSDSLLPGLDAIHEDFVERMLAFYRTNPSVTEMPGTSATFRQLKEHGIKVALNTGFSRTIAQTLIDRLGWERDGLIDASVTSDEVLRGRPHPLMIRHLMRQCRIKESRHVAKIGDAPADLLEGANADCGLVIGVVNGSSTRAQLAPLPHDYLIGSVAELPALLGL